MISQQNCSADTPMGATLISDQGMVGSGATFRAWAPRATAVYLIGVFDGVPVIGVLRQRAGGGLVPVLCGGGGVERV
jgi:1,4-alpha-glucan branching enzyme